jgi:aryl-alcohol dehydrogenase
MVAILAAIAHENAAPLSIEPVELAEPGPDEVRVRIMASGICHTDLTVLDYASLPWPAVLGHEGAGIVEAVGSNVKSIALGDHVVLCQPSCGDCVNCDKGQPSYCLQFPTLCMTGGHRADGTCTHSQGETKVFGQFLGQSSFASHAVVSARCVVPVDADVPFELLAPLSCGVQTGAGAVLNALRPEPGQSIAIFGAGAVGLSALMAAKIAGCHPIIAVDKVASRLDLARELGATHMINATVQDPVAAIHAIAGGVDGSIEASGHGPVMEQAVAALAHNGTAVLLTSGPELKLSVDMMGMQMRGTKIRASLLCADGTSSQLFIPKLIKWWKAGLFPFDRMIGTYAFDDINQAIQDCVNGSTVKPVLKVLH